VVTEEASEAPAATADVDGAAVETVEGAAEPVAAVEAAAKAPVEETPKKKTTCCKKAAVEELTIEAASAKVRAGVVAAASSEATERPCGRLQGAAFGSSQYRQPRLRRE
jgi:hypothetical protein